MPKVKAINVIMADGRSLEDVIKELQAKPKPAAKKKTISNKKED